MRTEVERTQNILKYTFGLVPIIAGLDKFMGLLTNWAEYVPDMVSMDSGLLMSIVGVIEIIAGILVLTKPKIGSLVVMGWLTAIAFVLIIGGQYDIAVRDLVMAIGAYALFVLTTSDTPQTT